MLSPVLQRETPYLLATSRIRNASRSYPKHPLDELGRELPGIVGFLYEAPMFHQKECISVVERDVHVVKNRNHSAFMRQQFTRNVEQMNLVVNVEARRWFIKKEIVVSRRTVVAPYLREYSRKLHFLLLAAGQRRIVLRTPVEHSHHLERAIDDLDVVSPRRATVMRIPAHQNDIPHRQRKGELDVLR